MSTAPTIDYEKIKGVHKIPLEELYTSGHRTCQGCESATTMRGFHQGRGSAHGRHGSDRLHVCSQHLVPDHAVDCAVDAHPARRRRLLSRGHGRGPAGAQAQGED